MMKKISKFDLFPKTAEDYRMRTVVGGAISLLTVIIFLSLVLIEMSMFLDTRIEKELRVDSNYNEKLNINLDITFPSLPCAYISLDAVDVSGESILDVQSDISMQRLNRRGTPISESEVAKLESEIQRNIKEVPVPQNHNGCDSCYGAENTKYPCCSTCEDVREAYRDKGWAFSNSEEVAQCRNEGYSPRMISQRNEGCRMAGSLSVAKVAGNFHIAPGRSMKNSHSHTHDVGALSYSDTFNTTHIIHSLSFGEEFEGRIDPLDGTSGSSEAKVSLFQYFVKIVPTTYHRRNGEEISTNQYSVTQHYQALSLAHDNEKLAGLFFIYDLSPIQVVLRETSQSWADFLTVIFGTAGGLFTVSTLADWFFSRSLRAIRNHKRR